MKTRPTPHNRPFTIQPSPTADTRSCDYSKVTKDQLRDSSIKHIQDVRRALAFFVALLGDAIDTHDSDKIGELAWFHADFITGFKQTGWWDNHRRITRHHLFKPDGVPEDVNLIDVLECVADCVMAGMGRTGAVYPLQLDPELLQRAVTNTVELLKRQITVAP